MNIKSNKGSITIFVLVGLLFMTGFLLISFASNVNKSKIVKEQFNIISGVYSYGDGDEKAYERAYTDIRRKNADFLTTSNEEKEDTSTLELTKTFKDTLSNYKIYGNSAQNGTPSPTNPVEILSVGDKTKNLINKKEISISSGYYYDSTGSESNADSRFIKLDPIKVESNTTYTLSCNLKIYTVWFFNDNNSISKENIETKEKSFTTPENCNQIRITLYNTSGTTDTSAFEWIQLEEGTEATEYEPYGYKIPVKVNGKNIFDPSTDTRFTLQEDGSYLSNTTIGTDTIIGNLKGIYTISLKVKCPIGKNYRIRVVYTDGTYIDSYKASTGEYVEFSFTTNGQDIEKVMWDYSSSSNEVQFKDFQIEEGTKATDYEPYVEPQIVNIYLDEPLRKVGSYTDYIDFSTGKVIRNVRNINLEISEMNNTEDYPGWKNDAVSILYEEFPNVNGYIPTVFLSNITTDVYKIGINTMYSHSVTLWLRKSSFNLTQTEWKTNYPNLVFDLYYGLPEPEEAETLNLSQLRTYEDYTRIEVLTEVAPSKIEATYYGYTME